VFLIFGVMSAFAGGLRLDRDKGGFSGNIATERSAIKAKIAKLELRRAEAFAARQPTAGLDQEIADDTKALEI